MFELLRYLEDFEGLHPKTYAGIIKTTLIGLRNNLERVVEGFQPCLTIEEALEGLNKRGFSVSQKADAEAFFKHLPKTGLLVKAEELSSRDQDEYQRAKLKRGDEVSWEERLIALTDNQGKPLPGKEEEIKRILEEQK